MTIAHYPTIFTYNMYGINKLFVLRFTYRKCFNPKLFEIKKTLPLPSQKRVW